jgi:ferritin-like metal-binding protein YciE
MEALSANLIDEQLVRYLTDAHAIEEQSLGLLRRARRSSGRADLREIYEQPLSRAEAHRGLLADRLEAHGARSSALKDAAMRLGAFNWGLIFQAQPDTPGRATAFAFALTHLKIAGYELLKRVAARAGDEATVAMTEQVLAEERDGASRLSASFDTAVEASLDAREAPRRPADHLLRMLAGRERKGSPLRPV